MYRHIDRMRFTICISILGLFMVTRIIRGEETCQTKCVAGCGEQCPEKKVCTKDEIDCGPKAKSPTDFCESDRVCLTSNCQCN